MTHVKQYDVIEDSTIPAEVANCDPWYHTAAMMVLQLEKSSQDFHTHTFNEVTDCQLSVTVAGKAYNFTFIIQPEKYDA